MHCIFVVTLHYQMGNGRHWEVFFCIILIFGTIFGEKIGYLTPGVPVCKVIHYCLSIHLEEIPSFFVLYIYFYGYFALSNGPNWEVSIIISIFSIIFGQYLCIWPFGLTRCKVTPYCLAINFEELPLCFVLKFFV